jgi:hypothetical protein
MRVVDWNDSALRPLLRPACVRRNREYTLWDADYCFGLSAFRCRLFFWFGCSVACTVNAMSEAKQREIAETLFERTCEQIRDAIRLEEARRAALVKNLYRLRALRLSRDRSRNFGRLVSDSSRS